MGTSRTIVDLYREVLGRTPSEIMGGRRDLGSEEMSALLDAYSETPNSIAPMPKHGEIWPLMSHHTYDDRALFGSDSVSVAPRALTLLLIHDGLVVADPLVTTYQLRAREDDDTALVAFNRATSDIARVEALIASGSLRLTRLRPSLSEANRAAALSTMGLDADLQVFTNFIEAGVALPTLSRSFQEKYIRRVADLYSCFGLEAPPTTNTNVAISRVKDLAAAVVEVSWQFAVAATDGTCDLAFRGSLEQYLAQALIMEGLGGDMGPGRHFSRLDLRNVPNVDPVRLSLSDALAIRSDDSFEGFRYTTRQALDRLEADEHSGVEFYRALASFEEAMHEGAHALRNNVTRTSFGDRVKSFSVPAALGAFSTLGIAPMGVVPAAAAGGAVSIATLVWQWFLGRGQNSAHPAALRYYSMLGRATGGT